MSAAASELWWIFVATTLVGLILTAAFVASVVIQQRRFLSTTRQFGGRLLAAQEEERAWLARELHDDIIQRVAMLGRDLEQLEQGGLSAVEPVRIAGIREELHDLAAEIRRLAHRMHPAVLDHLGLSAALTQLASEFEQQGLSVRTDVSTAPGVMSPHIATCLFRVAQEALRNVVRHAGVPEALLRLRQVDRGVVLEVEDSGGGFDTSAASARSGLGLTSVAERVRLVQGRLTIRSVPGEGTRIAAWAPLDRAP